MGLAGFIVSLAGVPTLGLCSMPGLCLSLLGLRRRPRGLASAGVVLGAIGSIWVGAWGLMVFVTGLWLIPLGFILPDPPWLAGITDEMDLLVERVEAYAGEHGELPPTLADVGVLSLDATTDPWGAAYLYRPDRKGTSFIICSPGPDGRLNTSDDLSAYGQR